MFLKKYFLSIIGVLLCLCSFISCVSNGSESSAKISSIEDTQKHINGKTYMATPRGDVWFKITFEGDNFTLWKALPSEGSWGEPAMRGTFNISEGRYSDTGQRYYMVRLIDRNADTDYIPLDCWDFDIMQMALYNCHNHRSGIQMQCRNDNPWD